MRLYTNEYLLKFLSFLRQSLPILYYHKIQSLITFNIYDYLCIYFYNNHTNDDNWYFIDCFPSGVISLNKDEEKLYPALMDVRLPPQDGERSEKDERGITARKSLIDSSNHQ